ncbi:hypothetical protein C0J52_13363 [Blattella germanica]|nr:hypothetical protein C0J52_13363 [Blattella germanica]
MESEVKRSVLSSDGGDSINDSSDITLPKGDSGTVNSKCSNEDETYNSSSAEINPQIECLGPLRQDVDRAEQNGSVTAELGFDEAPQSNATREKQRQIEAILQEEQIDEVKLKKLALSENGLINGKIFIFYSHLFTDK